MADALDSGSSEGNFMGVQVPPLAPVESLGAHVAFEAFALLYPFTGVYGVCFLCDVTLAVAAVLKKRASHLWRVFPILRILAQRVERCRYLRYNKAVFYKFLPFSAGLHRKAGRIGARLCLCAGGAPWQGGAGGSPVLDMPERKTSAGRLETRAGVFILDGS